MKIVHNARCSLCRNQTYSRLPLCITDFHYNIITLFMISGAVVRKLMCLVVKLQYLLKPNGDNLTQLNSTQSN